MTESQIQTPHIAQDLESSLADLQAARERDTSETWLQSGIKKTAASLEGMATLGNANPDAPHPVTMWLAKLPQNVGVGMIDAAVNTADAVKAFAGAAADSWHMPGFTAQEAKDKQQPPAPEVPPAPNPIYDGAKQAVLGFRDYLAQGSDTPDKVTQAISQYTIPFLGYSKLIGGLHGLTTAGTLARTGVAEAATAATVLAPHDPRAADLLQLGKHVEGKFGDAMNTIAPDGSLFNSYINYMTDRTDESDAEGRFKNVVDNLALTGAASAMIRATASTLKGGFATARYALENFGTGPRGLEAQKGIMAFHGSPATDIQSLQPGQGLSARGQGIYLSESQGVAKEYRSPTGAVYTVNVPDEKVNAMLNWDKPLMDQPAAKKAFADLGVEGQDLTAGEAYRLLSEKLKPAEANSAPPSWDRIDMSPSGDTAASKALSDRGIPGIVYPASGKYSNGGDTSRNLVVFDPKDATITHKNGEPVMPERRKDINKEMRVNAEKAPASGAGIVQTGKDHWTLFMDRKPQGSYGTQADAQRELDSLNESIFTGKDNTPSVSPSVRPPPPPIGVTQKKSIDEAAAKLQAGKQGKK